MGVDAASAAEYRRVLGELAFKSVCYTKRVRGWRAERVDDRHMVLKLLVIKKAPNLMDCLHRRFWDGGLRMGVEHARQYIAK